jgi:hypothetical protein
MTDTSISISPTRLGVRWMLAQRPFAIVHPLERIGEVMK